MSEYKQDRIEPENPIIDRQIRKTRFRGHMDANEFLKLASQEESETYPESLIGSSFGSGIHQGMVFRQERSIDQYGRGPDDEPYE